MKEGRLNARDDYTRHLLDSSIRREHRTGGAGRGWPMLTGADSGSPVHPVRVQA